MALSVLIKKICQSRIRFYSCSIQINDAYILSAARTPIGCFQGKLSSVSGVELATKALVGAIEKADICRSEIQELVLGCSCQTGMGQGVAHQVARFADLQNSTITWTLNKLCTSGMKAVMVACQLLYTHAQEIVAAGGLESVTNIPHALKRKQIGLGNICLTDLIIQDVLLDAIHQVEISHYAEQIVSEFNFTRNELDDYALSSYAKTARATMDGAFQDEIIPVTVKNRDDLEELVCEDETYKKVISDKFRKFPPITKKDGKITVGNSAAFGDGAAVLVLASGNYILKKDLTPVARIVAFSDANLPPNKFCITPSVVIPRVLLRANLDPSQIALWEIHESFAVTAMVNAKILKLPPERVNIHGGALGMGHPFGMSGARMLGHLVHALNSGELGCAAISQPTGSACAVIIEKL